MGSLSTDERREPIQGAKKQPLRLGCQEPYCKPTQVGEMRNLRRTEELTLRNSAKCICNLGRSMASSARRGCRVQAQATVYQKHRSLRTSNGKYSG